MDGLAVPDGLEVMDSNTKSLHGSLFLDGLRILGATRGSCSETVILRAYSHDHLVLGCGPTTTEPDAESRSPLRCNAEQWTLDGTGLQHETSCRVSSDRHVGQGKAN
jgi:hypothetical protein